MPSDPNRRDPSRRQKKALESVSSEEDLGGEGQLQSRSRHSRKPQKPHGNIIINGDVHIKNLNDFNLIHERRDEARPQRPSTPVRNATRPLQPNRKTTRSAPRCDSPSASEAETTTDFDDGEADNIALQRPANPRSLPERPRLHSEKKKCEQPDEGYHTSGTVSAYTSQIPAKGKEKGKEISLSPAGRSSSSARTSPASRASREGETETDATTYHSDEEHQDEISAVEEHATDQKEHLEDEEASDDVRSNFADTDCTDQYRILGRFPSISLTLTISTPRE